MTKQVEFTARPKLGAAPVPSAHEWVTRGGEGRGGTTKLTLYVPSELHMQLKIRCVREGVTLQEKVHTLILTEMSDKHVMPDSPA